MDTIIDTNILIRFFIRDNEAQYQKSYRLIKKIEKGEIKGLISLLVVNETVWVLQHYYELKREIFIPKLLQLFALKNIKIMEVEKARVVVILTTIEKSSLDFTDAYLLQVANKRKIASFNHDLSK
ncbi:hypothetical protein AUK04_03710 [Candidatus Roizmanbacteria bacterium CG2_30_33_16]|uniref:PIN domain-containing protein n=5 Tax=Candidatus Roizmaniibacteriota TaxID=1752723 RepID=A0A2M7E525_9BACT|nr:type II toxin-antitoxin system VapC family toxin [Candidatus Roizmanbacteria bacterium]OIP83132.1 MAG: hypothetical protein AUK04_03710 [Candidatus Roizmanbacteria bacterium CG2_30_33_16]PIP63908.1 MAG: hypothetical protein COW96_05515 [Candidatus Roizmanbacteria bacterium CG22_combo_CG10-13_8_21_14_all_33_16]PIV62815.1 MAG: hypothetical protein COS12_00915 [Candidatus Roizmanbacteria bacterium CG01_land_8_20_14_3_00_33_9]PIX74118.1 MAG: hypothetical protein COZ39_01000 [Candidatus Roizmanba